ncbi:MAG: endospore germination permease [Alicyclobacillus sp.]|nr:endospore germination permease [Alicyclobacillus sp.]
MRPITRYQVMLILTWTVLGTGILTMPSTMARFAPQDMWMSCAGLLVGGAISSGVAWLHVRMFPNHSLTDALKLALGPWAGTLAAAWVVVCLVIATATIGREFSAFTTTVALPNTAEFVAAALATGTAAYLAHLGLHILGRVNEFLVPIFCIAFPVLFFLSLGLFDWSPFKPVLASGWVPVWRSSIVPLFVYGLEFTLALQWVPSLEQPRKLPIDILIAALASTFLLAGIVFVSIGALGGALSYLNYPALEVARAIRLGKFIERLDTLYGMGVVTILVIKLASFETALTEGFRSLCNTGEARRYVWPSACFVWSLSYFLFRDNAEVAEVTLYTLPTYFAFTFVLLPLSAYLAMKLRFPKTS